MPVLVYHSDFKLHDPSPYPHPETPERLDRMLSGLNTYNLLDSFKRVDVPVADINIYSLVHSEDYLREVMRRGREGLEWLDPDTYICPGTHRALERLAGAAMLISEVISGGSDDLVLLLPRPPGHHAGISGPAMGAPTLGFCILNTSALIARLLSKRGRVSVLDFDLHHGNGTQEIVYGDPRVQHIDIHQDPHTIYPGTGYTWQIGEGAAAGTKANIILPPGSGDDVFSEAVSAAVRILERFDPDYIVVSAGFDGYRGDNYMGAVRATASSYYRAGSLLAGLSRPVVVVVEGGYSIGLERGLPAFIAGLLKRGNPVSEDQTKSSGRVKERFREELAELLERLGMSLGAGHA